MKVVAAQHPMGADRFEMLVSEDGTVIAAMMLDGASSFVPVPVDPGDYADVLIGHIGMNLYPEVDLRATLHEAIAATADDLDLTPGRSPSSTVTIVRQLDDEMECLILGDNLVILPDRQVTDDRMAEFGDEHRLRYQRRLRDGHGWDGWHAQILGKLQAEQIEHRNRAGGYWIAEASPEAADHAIVIREPISAVPWAVFATDGAYKTMNHLGINDWTSISRAAHNDLKSLLVRCQDWEDFEDPRGQQLPRAKIHDDKSLAVATFSSSSTL